MIPLAFFVLSLENELQCHCLNVRINSGDDVAMSRNNFVNFCLVTPEIIELICGYDCSIPDPRQTYLIINLRRRTFQNAFPYLQIRFASFAKLHFSVTTYTRAVHAILRRTTVIADRKVALYRTGPMTSYISYKKLFRCLLAAIFMRRGWPTPCRGRGDAVGVANTP